MNLGKRFKYYREKAGIKQKDAAELIGVKYYQLGNYETNRSEPNIATLKKMSEVYGVSVDLLIGNTGVKNKYLPDDLSLDDPLDFDELVECLEEIVNKIKNKQ